MDPYIHTLVATGLVAGSFYLGKFFGDREGRLWVCSVIMEAMGAVELELDEDGTIVVTYDDGNKETFK